MPNVNLPEFKQIFWKEGFLYRNESDVIRNNKDREVYVFVHKVTDTGLFVTKYDVERTPDFLECILNWPLHKSHRTVTVTEQTHLNKFDTWSVCESWGLLFKSNLSKFVYPKNVHGLERVDDVTQWIVGEHYAGSGDEVNEVLFVGEERVFVRELTEGTVFDFCKFSKGRVHIARIAS